MSEEIKLPEELYHFTKVLDMGAKKYGANSWLRGEHFNHRDNHASMSRHLAEAYMGVEADAESGLDPLLHLATRALMAHTLKQRGSLYVQYLPGLEVTSKGKVRKNGKEYKPCKMGEYLGVCHKGEKYYLHRIIGLTFLRSSFFEGAIINHKDGNKLNNDVNNLEWVSFGENLKHAYDTGLLVPYDKSGYNHPQVKLTPEDVEKAISLREKGLSYREIADQFNVSRHCISRTIARNTSTPTVETITLEDVELMAKLNGDD